MRIQLAPGFKNTGKNTIGKDVLAGLILMAVSIPISMGYAQIAGLPAVYGLYGSVFPILLFALFSSSPQFVFGVDAAPALPLHLAVAGKKKRRPPEKRPQRRWSANPRQNRLTIQKRIS